MIISFACLFCIGVHTESLDSETDGLELIPQHTVHPPFLSQYWKMVRGGVANENITSSSVSTSGGLSNWDFGASTIITNDRVSMNSGWFRNVNKLHSIFTDGWRVILRLQYTGFPEVPLIFTYSTMKGNYPFLWTEIEVTRGQRGASALQVRTGGLNVTQGSGSYPLPVRAQSGEESVEVQFLYNRRMEKLVVNVGESGTECLRVSAELEDGYHFGLQSAPPSIPVAPDWRWYLTGFYFTSLPHYAFISSSRSDGKQPAEISPFSQHKTTKTDSIHQFIRSREDRDKQQYEHHGTEEREQASYMQRMAEAQRRRMEIQERARKEAQMRATPDPYAGDEDDDNDDDDNDDLPPPISAAEKERIRKRIFDREMDITDADYDGEYDSGGTVSNGAAARRRRHNPKHQVVNPNKAPTRPPQRRGGRTPPRDAESVPPITQPPPIDPPKTDTGNAAQQQVVPPSPPPQAAPPQPSEVAQSAFASQSSQAPPPPPPSPTTPDGYQQATSYPNQFGGGAAQPPPPPPSYGQYQYPYGVQQPFYGNPYGEQQGGYAPNMPPPPQQQYYQQPPPPPQQQQNPFQQPGGYQYRPQV